MRKYRDLTLLIPPEYFVHQNAPSNKYNVTKIEISGIENNSWKKRQVVDV